MGKNTSKDPMHSSILYKIIVVTRMIHTEKCTSASIIIALILCTLRTCIQIHSNVISLIVILLFDTSGETQTEYPLRIKSQLLSGVGLIVKVKLNIDILYKISSCLCWSHRRIGPELLYLVQHKCSMFSKNWHESAYT